MNKIIAELQNRNEISAWQVSHTQKTTQEFYITGREVDTFRRGQNSATRALLHTSRDKKIGENRFSFEGACHDPALWVDAAIERAALVHNPPYPLSPPWQIDPEIENPVFDVQIAAHATEKIHELAAEAGKLGQKLPGRSRISFLECFLTHTEETLKNHRGLDLYSESTRVMYDMALLSEDGAHEVYFHAGRNRLEDIPLEKVLEQESKALLDTSIAVSAPTGRYPVILAEEALDTLFQYFTGHASGEALYQGYSAFEEGKPVLSQEFPLSIRSNPFLPGGAAGGFYDLYGYPLLPVELIQNGVCKNFAINGKYAAHLGRPMTSALSNIEVKPGVEPLDNLRENGTLELVKFSTFSPDPVSGSFSGEIRLGYFYQNGHKKPIKGGSVSAAGPQVFTGTIFSKESIQRESYAGPQGIFFPELTIAGEG